MKTCISCLLILLTTIPCGAGQIIDYQVLAGGPTGRVVLEFVLPAGVVDPHLGLMFNDFHDFQVKPPYLQGGGSLYQSGLLGATIPGPFVGYNEYSLSGRINFSIQMYQEPLPTTPGIYAEDPRIISTFGNAAWGVSVYNPAGAMTSFTPMDTLVVTVQNDAGVAAVPEPEGWVLAMVGVAGWMLWKRRFFA